MRPPHIAAVALVLGLAIAGFVVARLLADRNALRESERRVDIAGAQIESRVEVATSLTASLSRFMSNEGAGGVTNGEFATNATRWLSPAGLPAAAWAEQVRAGDRAAYERRAGRPIVAPGERHQPVPRASSYLPTSLISGVAPMTSRGVDLRREPGIAAALGRAIRPGGVGATPVAVRRDGTRGLFLVAPAPNLVDGALRPGGVVVFLSEAALRAAARNPPGLRFPPAGRPPAQPTDEDTVRNEFAVAGQSFAVAMPKQPVSGAGAILPWIILAGGLLLAALAGALGVTSARRAKAQEDFDRIFNLTPDLLVVAGFDGHMLRANPAFGRVLGSGEQELLARSYLDFVHPDDRERTAAEAAAIGRGQTTLSFENRLLGEDGSLRVFEWTATPVVEDAVFYAVARDVTERRRAESESRRLAAEQSALRRVAELVARQAPSQEVFALVTEELSHLLDVNLVRTVRFEPDGSVTILASRGVGADRLSPGMKFPLGGGTVIDEVLRTGRPARVGGQTEGARSGAGGPIVVDGHLWGAMAVESTAGKLAPGSEDRVAQFAELVSTAISNVESRAQVERLAAEQSALRRVATLVARTPASEELFSTVAREVASVLDVPGVIVTRYEPDGSAVTLGEAFHSTLAGGERYFGVGSQMSQDPGSLAAQVFETHRPARIDDFATLRGTIGDLARAAGLGSGCAGPIVVNGALWGKMCVFSQVGAVLPAGTENRLNDFIELVATAIANFESRANVERLAAEQSALRRVAELVARGSSPDELFAKLVEELGELLHSDAASILRYEADASATVVAGWSDGTIHLPLGERLPLEGQNLAAEVLRTGKPQRKEDYVEARGRIAETVRELGFRSAVACPIVVDGAIWGVIAVLSIRSEPLPAGTEDRILEFSRHAGMAVANAKSRSDLAESRARIVRAGDEARRRFERDLHDGAQQRLVSLGLELRAAEATVPLELAGVQRVLSHLAEGLDDVVDDLRELSRGLHPAVLAEGGLVPALQALALRSAVPVELHIDADTERFEEPVEVAAYYVASEALTNTVKHAHASRAEVTVSRRDGWLQLSVRDDGMGGADASGGSGLTGLVDRVEAIGGTIEIDSPPEGGTTVRVRLPTQVAVSAAVDHPGRRPARRSNGSR